jgi:prolyl-tRNA synthetase
VRGDHRLSEIKLQNAVHSPVRPAREDEVREVFGTEPGFIGPIGARVDLIADEALRGLSGLVTGANEPDRHLRGVEPGRDFEPTWADVRSVEAGDTCPGGGVIRIEPAIEIGNIFKLGTRYSEPLGASYLDESGVEHTVVMGCYGIGPARILAAAIEQGADEKGIVWPHSIAPWQVHLVSLAKKGDDEERAAADRLYEELAALGLEVLYDDREAAGAGEKLTDAELLGCPLRIVVGRRGLAEGVVEASERGPGTEHKLPLGEAAAQARDLLRGNG